VDGVRRGRNRGQGSVVCYGSVEFQAPAARSRARTASWVNVAGYISLGVWSVIGSWRQHPLFGVLSGLVYLELALAVVRVGTFTGEIVYQQSLAKRIATPLVGLCARAGCRLPRVVIRDDTIRAACVRSGRRGPLLLVLSKPFLDMVDDSELRAILAHEVSHIARDDLAAAKFRAQAAGVAVGISAAVVIAVTTGSKVIVPVYLAGFTVLTVLLVAGSSLFNRRLEWRADGEGAWLADDPEHLASSLRKAHAFSQDARRRIYGPLPWRWLLSPLSWQLPSHPPMTRRITRLEQLAAARTRRMISLTGPAPSSGGSE